MLAGLGQAMMPQGTQGLGQALGAASPLLLAMSQGMRQGQGPFAYAPQGMAAMMQLQKQNEEQKAKEEAGNLIQGIPGLSGPMTHGPNGTFGNSYAAPTNVPQLDRNNPEAIAAGAMGALGKKPTPQAIREGLLARGLPEHVADGFLLNIRDESRFDPSINEINPTVPGSRGGFGLIQWTGPRRKALEQYAQQRGTPVDDLNTQLDFLMAELQGPESGAAQSILSTKDAGSAAAAIARDFLRPAQEHLQRRVAQYTGGQQMAQAGPQIDPQRARAILMHPETPDWAKQLALESLQGPDPMDALNMQNQQLQNARLMQQMSQGPEPTAMQRNYEFLLSQGVPQERALEMARGGVNVNVGDSGPQVGTIPQGFELHQDPETKAYSMRPIPGGPEDTSEQEAKAASVQADQEQTRSNVVSQTIDQIRSMIDGGGTFDLPEVGIIGDRLAKMGVNQEAVDMTGMLETLQGMVVFDRLEKLREASTSGASGLGQVTNIEIGLLGAQLGALKQNLSPDRLRSTLDTIDEVFGKLSPEAQAYLTGQTDTLPQAAPKAAGTGASTAVPQGGWPIDSDPPPAGMDPNTWRYLSPDEREMFR